MSRPSFNLDGNGRPVKQQPQQSRIWLPGEKKVEVAGALPTGPQVGPAPNGMQIQAVPQIKLTSTHEFVGLLIEVGPVTIPFPFTPDQADVVADKIKAEAQKVRDLQCLAESPATSPDASQAQDDTASTIGPHETSMGSGSIIAMPGSDSGDSSSASTRSVSGA